MDDAANGPKDCWRIGEAADQLAVTTRTLRYYEELGLIAPADFGGRARFYDEHGMARLRRIRELQEVGFNLDEIGQLLRADDRLDELRTEFRKGVTRARHADILAEALHLNRQVRSRVEARIRALSQFRDELDSTAVRYGAIAEEAGIDLPSPDGKTSTERMPQRRRSNGRAGPD